MYWQIAAGSVGREYSNYFLRFGMAFVGGDPHIETMEGVNAGDIVVLKQGTQRILAAGTVVQRNGIHRGRGDKEWLRDFDGWDLEAYCYVDWRQPDQHFVTNGLTRTTIQQLHQDIHTEAADNILITGTPVPLAPEPPNTNPVTDDRLLKFLIKEGLRVSSADDLTNTIRKVRLLADYYYNECSWEDIREHETRTFLVIPLLLALGWSEQQLKIELPSNRRKIDVACFRRNFRRDPSECVAIIETKGFVSGLDYAHNQAMMYAENFPDSKAVIVTNGYCYKIFLRERDQFRASPSAYINLLKPRDRYPLNPDEVGGALKAIKWLLPNSLI